MKHFLFLLLLPFGSAAWAQSLAPQSVNSAGIKLSQSNGSLSFTVGELLVKSQSDANGNKLGGGFTAGAAVTTVSIREPDVAVLSVNVFPNPTTQLVNIRINHSTLPQVMVSITDLQGREVYQATHAAVSNTIGVNMAAYPAGTYVLTLQNTGKQPLGTYQIIKQ